MADTALRGADLEERREAEAELAAALEGEPIAEPLASPSPSTSRSPAWCRRSSARRC